MDEQLDVLRSALTGRYDIERLLGTGGMALVYLARDIKHERPVAIKTLRPEVASSIGAERFLQEIRLTARLNHPHVLSLYDSGVADGILYYVMPFVDGPSLGQRLAKEKQLPIAEAVRLGREVAQALGHAHKHGLIHRDIKPDNILLSEGHALVADFGISRAVSAAGGERLTQTGTSIGTPAYMSPEQAAGDPDIDSRADVYSLGCVLYETLVGQIPFPAPTLQAMMARHTLEKVSSPSVMRPSVTPALEAVVTKCMAKNPVDRFKDGAQLAETLALIESGETSSSSIAVTGARGSAAWPTMHRVRRIAMGVAGAVVVGSLAAWSFGFFDQTGTSDRQMSTIAVLPFENIGAEEDEYFAAGLSAELTIVLSGIKGLRVAGHRSTRTLRDANADITEIGRTLGVASVLEGDVRKIGNDIRVSARLVNVEDGAQLWSNHFDRTVDDVFAVQAEIAQSLVAELRGELVAESSSPEVAAATTDPMAYDKYLWGQYNLDRQTQAGLTDAVMNFSMSIGFDSGFAGAYAGLAEAQLAIVNLGVVATPEESLVSAAQAASTALRLNPRLAGPRVVLGDVKAFSYNWDGAEGEYVRALENAPEDPLVRERYARLLVARGRLDAALVHARAAVQSDALSTSAHRALLQVHRNLDDPEAAIESGRKILALDPTDAATWLDFGLLFLSQGRADDAMNAFEGYAERRAVPDASLFGPFVTASIAHAEQGTSGTLSPALIELMQAEPIMLAVFHQLLGDTDGALSRLERALRNRHPRLGTVTTRPELRSLIDVPRYRAILADIGLLPS